MINRRSEEHTSELQSPCNLVCRLLLEKKNKEIQEQHTFVCVPSETPTTRSHCPARYKQPNCRGHRASLKCIGRSFFFFFFFLKMRAPTFSPSFPRPRIFRL